MMLAQFQVRYPTGSLISELLTIYQGKFVVRVSAQVEGVLRATGMAASESLELAEDQARNRTLMVLGIESVERAGGDGEDGRAGGAKEEEQKLVKEIKKQVQATNTDDLSEQFSPAFSLWSQGPEDLLELGEMSDVAPEINAHPQTPFNNVTPLTPRSYSPQATGAMEQIGSEKMEAREPVDLSDAIARTTVELKRLRWNNQQGREYLKQTYNKRSRQELTDEEMMEFLHYLESQPSP